MPTQQLRRVAGPAPFGLKKAADLLGNEYTIGVLIPLALVALYWLVEVSA